MEHDKDKALREDLLFVCKHSAVANNDPSVLRSLLFRKTQIDPKSWQGFALSSDLWDNLSLREGRRISRIRSNHTRMIEGHLMELASSFGGFSKQIVAIAHAVEYFLFITSPDFSKYDDIDQLRRRSLQMIHFMAQRIRIRRKRRTRKRKCLDDRPLTVKAVKIEYCPKSDIIHHEIRKCDDEAMPFDLNFLLQGHGFDLQAPEVSIIKSLTNDVLSTCASLSEIDEISVVSNDSSELRQRRRRIRDQSLERVGSLVLTYFQNKSNDYLTELSHDKKLYADCKSILSTSVALMLVAETPGSADKDVEKNIPTPDPS